MLGITSGSQNVAVGQQALFTGTTSTLNTAIGSQALQNATGDANTALGNFAGNLLTTGSSNILIGNQAGGAGAGALGTGNNNVAIGNCVSVASGSGNCQLAIGVNTMCWITGNSTGAIKPGAGIIDCANSCGTAGQVLASNGSNAICWANAPTPVVASPTTQGIVFGSSGGTFSTQNNVAFGYQALNSLSGNQRGTTAIGWRTLCGAGAFTCGNTAVGAQALSALTTGVNNTAIGGPTMFGGMGATLVDGNNNTLIGSGADVAASNSSNSVTLGNASISVIRAQVNTITALSDARDKTAITALPVGLDFVNSLNPVKFTWQMREPNEVKDGTSEAGFIAQELKAAQEAAGAEYLGMVYEDNPEKLEASPGKLVPVLVKAIQELSAKVDTLQTELNALKANG
jgi:hypothetical protein